MKEKESKKENLMDHEAFELKAQDIEKLLGITVAIVILLIAMAGIGLGLYLITYPETFVHILGILVVIISSIVGAASFYQLIIKSFKNAK